jgi:hypothetical protein
MFKTQEVMGKWEIHIGSLMKRPGKEKCTARFSEIILSLLFV